MSHRLARKFVWFFDLDNTLHDATHAIFQAIDSRMTDYGERHLVVDRAEANRLRELYWRRYGATLLGLVRHHAQSRISHGDADAEQFAADAGGRRAGAARLR